ncbi:hypothetical protein [Fluviicola taffensis]|uniref:Uncharacterized protein n=1 Tax=Fluviicola taffensis (strain DSM 16823 / NCIMB 13979 / RW262) TaxID=755732 RepID=F2I9T4_FLUTR|nr:hypothetical protein [Fluviicola taffensis]AEA43080.1 hypothetical protein Fluta_1082 [Fluviicola taffensis DSM 16823]
MQKLILLTSGLVILFFTLMWIAFPFLNDVLLKEIMRSAKSTGFSNNSINGLLALRLKTALSFGAIPLLLFGNLMLIKRLKNPEYPRNKFRRVFILVIATYFIGFFLKFMVIKQNIALFERYRISEAIVNDIPLDQIYFYDFPLILNLITCLLFFLFAKRKVSSNTL